MWFNAAFYVYNERVIEMARAHSADEELYITEYCPFQPTVLGRDSQRGAYAPPVVPGQDVLLWADFTFDPTLQEKSC